MRGTLLLTASSLLTKILGFIYIIPFTALVGTSGYALYKYAYGPYTLMLSLSTMGLPLAVSKFRSCYTYYYNTSNKNNYDSNIGWGIKEYF